MGCELEKRCHSQRIVLLIVQNLFWDFRNGILGRFGCVSHNRNWPGVAVHSNTFPDKLIQRRGRAKWTFGVTCKRGIIHVRIQGPKKNQLYAKKWSSLRAYHICVTTELGEIEAK